MMTSFCTTPSRRDTAAEVDTPEPGSDIQPEAAPEPGTDEWTDGGDSWWAPHPVPPSYRDAP